MFICLVTYIIQLNEEFEYLLDMILNGSEAHIAPQHPPQDSPYSPVVLEYSHLTSEMMQGLAIFVLIVSLIKNPERETITLIKVFIFIIY